MTSDKNTTEAKDIRKSLFTSTLAGMLGMSWFAVAYGIPTTMLFESMTGSGIMIGLFTTFQQLASIFQIPSVIVSEHFKSRKKYWGVLAMTNRILWFSPAIMILCMWNRPNLAAIILLLILGISAGFGQAATPVWLHWMSDLIPEKISERYWGVRQSFTISAFLLATIVSGIVLDIFPSPEKSGGSYTGFLIVFFVATLLGVFEIVIHLKVPDVKRISSDKISEDFGKLLLPMKNSDFRNMTLAYAFWYLALCVLGHFGLIYLKRTFSVNYTQIAIISASSLLSMAIFGFINGRLIEKIGARTYFCIALFVIPLTWIVWFFLRDETIRLNFGGFLFEAQECVVVVCAAVFAGGVFASGIGVCQFHMTNVLAEKEWRGIGIAEHWTIVGLIAAGGPFIGGAITDYFTKFPIGAVLPLGQRISYVHILLVIAALIAWALSVPLMLKVKLKKDEVSVSEAMSIACVYPLRGISVIYNMSVNIGSIISRK
jgi:MFS family permease